MTKTGKLYLIPSPLGEDGLFAIPHYAIEVLHRLTYLVAERAKTARHFIKKTNPPKHVSEYIIHELNEHSSFEILPALLNPAMEGHDIGLLSEAGCPGVADPGAGLVELAHHKEIEVVPFVGPSSILLALMASGMNGQQFCFHGYLPPRPGDLAKELKRLESLSEKHNQTQIFIETPYRNKNIVEQAFKTLAPDTWFCIAADLTLPTQYISTKQIIHWNKSQPPDLHKRPAVFLVHRKS